jgi:IMP dehydrogenase
VNYQDLPLALSFGDVLLAPQYSELNSRSEVDLSTKISEKITLDIPLMSINMDDVTGVKMAIAMGKAGGLGLLPRFDTPDIQADKVSQVKAAGVLTAGAVGCKESAVVRAEKLVAAGVDVLTLDVAHGQLRKAIDLTAWMAERFGKEITIMSGVVGTYEGAKDLFKAGADCVRIGVGPGTICTTRTQTGHGMPQITAIFEGARAAREAGKTIVSDGGTENSGDVVKALAAGASGVITGYQLAGSDETPGKLREIDGKKYKDYNASTSRKEKMKQLKKYKNGKGRMYVVHVEGIESLVPYRGPVAEVIESMMAGVRSGFSYSGARTIEELWKKAKFMRVTQAGVKENNPHGVIVNGTH